MNKHQIMAALVVASADESGFNYYSIGFWLQLRVLEEACKILNNIEKYVSKKSFTMINYWFIE